MLAPFVLNPLFSTGRVIRMTGCSQLLWCSAAWGSCQSLLSGRMAMQWCLATCETEHPNLLRGKESPAAQCLTPRSVEGVGILFFAQLLISWILPAFFHQPGQICIANIINIILSIKILKQRSGIHWAATALLQKNKTLVSTCPFGKLCGCFGWCTKQIHYYIISTTIPEFRKRYQQILNCEFFKRCTICIASLKVWESSRFASFDDINELS